jgi:hypothetical protein
MPRESILLSKQRQVKGNVSEVLTVVHSTNPPEKAYDQNYHTNRSN